jgi:hypothetical protein
MKKKYQVQLWDDFHDDGSEDPAPLGEFESFDHAKRFALASARVGRVYSYLVGGRLPRDGDPDITMSDYRVQGPQIWSSTEAPEALLLPTEDDIQVLHEHDLTRPEQKRRFFRIRSVELELFAKLIAVSADGEERIFLDKAGAFNHLSLSRRGMRISVIAPEQLESLIQELRIYATEE